MILYKDGVGVDTAAVAPSDQIVSDATVSIGSFGTNGWRWQGTIDDARIYRRALSPQQVAALYSTGSDIIVPEETASTPRASR